MRIKELNPSLGDDVLIYVHDNNALALSEQDKYLLGRIISISGDRNRYVIGWKDGQLKPIDIDSNPNHINYPHKISDIKDYEYWFNYYADENIHSIVKPVAPALTYAKISYDISHWRAWSHNIEGDCPCGILKTRCEYHQ